MNHYTCPSIKNRLVSSIGVLALLTFSPIRAVSLGGVNIPKEKLVVYLLIGHSNMAGQDLAHSDPITAPKVWNYEWNSTKTWVLAKETPNSPKTGLSGHGAGGPGMPFLKAMSVAYPDYYFGVINNASLSATCRGENTGHNGSGLDPSDNRYWKGTFLYEQIITSAKEIQKDVTLGGILCMLGAVEATRTTDSVCRAFSSDISQLIKDMRTDLNEPNLPFLMGEYEAGATGTFSTTLPLPGIIASETKLIPTKLNLAATVDSKGISMLDDHHYTADKGQPEWAKRAVAIIKTKAWFPPPATASIVMPKPTAQITLAIRPTNSQAIYLINGAKLPAEIQVNKVPTMGLKW
jgi:hypothetical protein